MKGFCRGRYHSRLKACVIYVISLLRGPHTADDTEPFIILNKRGDSLPVTYFWGTQTSNFSLK